MLLAAAVFFSFFLSAALPLVGHTVPAAPSPREELAWVKEAAGGSLRGRNALVTGASRGIGREVAHLLARVAGAHTILACRDISACQRTAQEIRQLAPAASVECAELDLARLSSVERFAEAFAGGSASSARPLHLLVHNAGVMAVDDHRTEDGFESTFQVNHLAPFYLTNLLLPSLRAASSASSLPPPPLPTPQSVTSPPAPSAAAPQLHTCAGERHEDGGARAGGGGEVAPAAESWGAGVRVVWVSSGAHKWGDVPGRIKNKAIKEAVDAEGSQRTKEGDGNEGGGSRTGRVDSGRRQQTGLFAIAFSQRTGPLGRWVCVCVCVCVRERERERAVCAFARVC
jgi:NAD(P)-dependent dehydrogenase (short-subunit alcohol dehydrogenase family)